MLRSAELGSACIGVSGLRLDGSELLGVAVEELKLSCSNIVIVTY